MRIHVPLETSPNVLLSVLALEIPASFSTMGTVEDHLLLRHLTQDQADCNEPLARLRGLPDDSCVQSLLLKEPRLTFYQIAEP